MRAAKRKKADAHKDKMFNKKVARGMVIHNRQTGEKMIMTTHEMIPTR